VVPYSVVEGRKLSGGGRICDVCVVFFSIDAEFGHNLHGSRFGDSIIDNTDEARDSFANEVPTGVVTV